VQALCIGVNDYKEETKLENAIADAEGFAQFIENLPDSSARAVCRNPESKVALRREIESFLSDLPKRPPRIVLIFYAGHAVQEGNQIFLLPANANPKTQEDLKSTCFSHDELFKMLKVKVDDKIEVEDVLYLVILDACRVSLQRHAGRISPVLIGFSAESHEPLPENRPAKWVLCTSTARGNFAYTTTLYTTNHGNETLSKKKGYHPSILPTPNHLKRTPKDRRQAATARPCPTTCSPRATAYVRSVSVHQILHTARRRLQSGQRQGNAHRAPTRPTTGFALTACWDFRRNLGAIRSQLLL
jgi:hypothetical protein